MLEAKGEAQERHENALVKAGDKLILLGGRGMKAVDIYNTRTKEWTKGAQPPLEINHIQAVSLDGLVYIAGAFTGNYPYETPISSVLIYDPVLDKWAIGPEIPANRRRGAAGVAVYNNKIYIVNGIINGHTSGWVRWLDEFDPATNKWTVLPDAPMARDHVHAVITGDKLYVAGGRRSGNNKETFSATVKETNVFDFKTKTWKVLPSPEGDIPTERAGAAVALYKGDILLMGGETDKQEAHNEVEALNPSTGKWKSLTPLNKGRHGTQAVYFDDIVIIGAGSGNRGGGPELNTFEIFSEKPNPEIPSTPLIKGQLTASAEKLVFQNPKKGDSKSIEIENKEGNQGILLTYIMVENTADFDIKVPAETPYVLAPGKKLSIEVVYKGSQNSKPEMAQLLIKSLGDGAPLAVPVVVEK